MSSGTDQNFATLGRRLQAARERAFVGREEELAAFRSALYGDGLSVLYVHGPGGVGKSALLRRFAQEATAAGRPVIRVDGRTLDPSPAAFEAEADLVLRDERAVLLVDTFERCQGLEGWLRERFLPRTPIGALVIVAGRTAPDVQWEVDAGWMESMKAISLSDLPLQDARAMLDARGVAPDLHEPLLAFAGGHPLALSLGAAVAVKDEKASTRWVPSQEVVATLLDQLVGEVPSPAHRHALEVCAHAYTTTEDLLRAALPDDAASLFAWLRRLPFIESSSLGVFPHDVVREALEADLRWRDPHGYAAVHHRVHAHLAARVRDAPDPEVLPAVGALFHLHRDNAMTAEFHTWRGEGKVQEDIFRPEDTSALVRLAATAETQASAAGAAFWSARQPAAFRVYRWTETGDPVAFCAWLRLEEPVEEEIAADPITAAAWAHARATAPLRPDEHLAIGRTWVLAPYRGNSPVMDLIQWRAVGYCLRAERMAWSYMAMPDPDSSRDYLRHYGMTEISQRPRLDDEPYGLFAHDWRATPAEAWLARLNRLLLSGGQEHPATPPVRLAVLSQPQFAAAIRQALRGLARPASLATNPLTRSRLLTGHSAPDAASALRELLEQAIEAQRDDPRAAKFHRAMSTTFLQGAPTQEVAAERLGLPFTTYRRHLSAGIERVCEDLWHREVHGTDHPA
ncbi:ATP-binding protein [Streptosporangium sp. CA-135522]|uniref:ATP-binding protein n=1 Tax=Streptosporangium sp. CA-135522 TaxID=3240072 RepID=UPI003D93CE59